MKIGDTECSPKLDYIIAFESTEAYAHVRDHRRTRTCKWKWKLFTTNYIALNYAMGKDLYKSALIESLCALKF